MGLSLSTPSTSPNNVQLLSGLPGAVGGPPAFPCFPSGQFLCVQQNAQCAALADFYCATNGWLWAQGAQGAGWSAAAGCYASTPALGCVAPVPPVATDYCTFYGVSCATDGTTVTALVLAGMGTAATNVLAANVVATQSQSWGHPNYGGQSNYFTGMYAPWSRNYTVGEPVGMFALTTCRTQGLVPQYMDSGFVCAGAYLNASGMPGPWYCPSYLSGGSSMGSPGPAWNFTSTPPVMVAVGIILGSVTCAVGLAASSVTNFGQETQSCIGCYLYGSLPSSLGNLTGLTALVLNTNLLSSSLPESLSRLTYLTDLEIAANVLTGTLPASFGSLTLLETLDFNNNALRGPIPPDLGNLAALTYLSLVSNELEGSIPLRDALCRTFNQSWPIIVDFELSSTGLVAAPIGIHLANNLLSGTLDACIGNMTGLLFFDVGYNQLGGTIPDVFANLGGYVAAPHLPAPPSPPPPPPLPNGWPVSSSTPVAPAAPNAPPPQPGWSSEMTDEMEFGIVGLGYLGLNNNLFSGSIPSSIGSLSYLHHLDLSSNALSGEIPDSLEWLVSGANCDISSAFDRLELLLGPLFGLGPPPWCFSSLQLDSNRLTGVLPAWLGSFGAPFGPGGPGSDASEVNLNSGSKKLSLTNNLFTGLGDPAMFSAPQFAGFVGTQPNAFVPPSVSQLPGPFVYGCPAGLWRSGLDDLVNGSSYFPVPVCSPCALGFVAPQSGTEICSPCLVNQYATGDGVNCAPCPQNAVSAPGSPTLSSCTCLYGTIPSYAPDGSFTCIQCSAGTFHQYGLSGNSTCVPCAPGTFSASGALFCAACPPGYYSDMANTVCTACQAGAFLNGTSLACSPCPAGSFTNSPAATHCQLPPAGFVSSPKTTHASSVSVSGLSASSFGPTQNATLTSSLAATLNLTQAAISITSVADVAARRRLTATQMLVNFTAVTTGNAATAAVLAALTAPAFTQNLVSSLVASGDAVLGAVSANSITASAPVATTVFLDAEPCAAGTFLDGFSQSCIPCAVGTVAPTSSATTCTACPARSVWLNASVACFPCPDDSVTSPNQADQCACSHGFYDTLFGASLDTPVCAPCPLGGVCTTGFVAADADWWRENTTSDVFYKCKLGKCVAENVTGPLTVINSNASSEPARRLLSVINGNASDPSNCVSGSTGPLCALCIAGYAIQAGECLPCNPADAFTAWPPGSKAALVLLCTLLALLFIAVAFMLPLSPGLQTATAKSAGLVQGTVSLITSLPKRIMQCCSAKKQAPSARLPPTKVMEDSDDALSVRGAASKPGADSASAAEQAQRIGAQMAIAGAASSMMLEAELVEGSSSDSGDGDDGLDDGASELLRVISGLMAVVQKYAKILVNFFQIVSTLLSSIDIPWPPIFVQVMSKVSIINLNFIRLPKAACLSPNVSYYDEFMTYTLGFLSLCLAIGAIWVCGRLLSRLSLRGMSETERCDRRRQFSSICLQRLLMLMYFCYPGVSVAIFGMLSCTKVGDHSWLNQDFRITCDDRTWWRYVGAAIVWIVLVPLGIPAFFNRLLHRYRVPDMAALVEDNAWLREAAEHSWRLGIPQPATDVQKLCCDTIDDAHLSMLHAVLIHGADASHAADILAGRAPELPAAKRAGAADELDKPPKARCSGCVSVFKAALASVKKLRVAVSGCINPSLKLASGGHAHSRELRLSALLLWCRHAGVLSIGAAGWTDDLGLPDAPPDKAAPLHAPHHTGLRSHEVPALLKLASDECGFLFVVYRTDCYYWESVELLRKLTLTSILALVSPGSAGQVVMGCLVALFALLANLKLEPFASHTLNLVNSVVQLNLFFYLFVALLLKVNLDGDNSQAFYTGIVGTLTLLPIVLPFALQAYLKLGSWGEQKEDLDDAAEEGDTEEFS